MPERIIKDFTHKDYWKVWEGPSAAFVHRFETKVLRGILPDQPGWFLDVASGYGRLLPLYHRWDRKIVLVDYALNLLEMAAEAYPYENVYFVAANAYHLPFHRESFAAGLSAHTFAHMNASQAFLDEISRVMRGGAKIVIEYPNKRSLFRIFRYGLRSFRHDQELTGELLLGTHPAYFAELARSAGLTVLHNRGAGFVGRVLHKAPFLRLALTPVEAGLISMFGPTKLAPRNFAELQKVSATGTAWASSAEPDDLIGILACPACGGSVREVETQGVCCSDCGRLYPRNGSILDLRYRGDAEVVSDF